MYDAARGEFILIESNFVHMRTVLYGNRENFQVWHSRSLVQASEVDPASSRSYRTHFTILSFSIG